MQMTCLKRPPFCVASVPWTGWLTGGGRGGWWSSWGQTAPEVWWLILQLDHECPDSTTGNRGVGRVAGAPSTIVPMHVLQLVSIQWGENESLWEAFNLHKSGGLLFQLWMLSLKWFVRYSHMRENWSGGSSLLDSVRRTVCRGGYSCRHLQDGPCLLSRPLTSNKSNKSHARAA